MQAGQPAEVGESQEWSYDMRYKMQQVHPTLPLYCSGYKSAKDLAVLQEEEITHILVVRDARETYIGAAFPGMFTYGEVLLQNSPFEGLLPMLPNIAMWMHNALYQEDGITPKPHSRLLVHCLGGISRAPILIVAYLMSHHAHSFTKAYQTVQRRRFCVNPIEGFVGQLRGYEPILDARRVSALYGNGDGGMVGGEPSGRGKRELEDDDEEMEIDGEENGGGETLMRDPLQVDPTRRIAGRLQHHRTQNANRNSAMS